MKTKGEKRIDRARMNGTLNKLIVQLEEKMEEVTQCVTLHTHKPKWVRTTINVPPFFPQTTGNTSSVSNNFYCAYSTSMFSSSFILSVSIQVKITKFPIIETFKFTNINNFFRYIEKLNHGSRMVNAIGQWFKKFS